MKKNEVVIFADKSEKVVPELLSELGANVRLVKLEIGDYVVSERVVIERKTIFDFANSVKSKRFFKQLYQLQENFEKPLLIIEGNLRKIKGIYPEGARGALSFVFLSFNVPIICCQDKKETAEMVFTIAKQEQLIRPLPSLFPKRKVLSKEDEIVRIIESLPDIGPVTAKNIKEYIVSLKDLALKDKKELYKIPGIGKKKAEKIYELFHTSIDKDESL